MKKCLILCSLLLIALLPHAQITITASDMPSSGDIIHYSTTQDLWNTDGSLTGTNYTWDFSFLTPQSQRSDTFASVSSTPFAYQFFFNNQILYPDHHSDHAIPVATGGGPQGGGPVSITNVYNYYRIQNDAYIQTGFGSNINGVPSSTQYSPRDFIYRFPMTYGSTDASLADYLIVVPTLGAYGQTIDRTNEVDGWGTLITPFGTFQTLRLKTTIAYTDTFFVDQVGFGTSFPRPPVTEYHWLAANSGTPLLSITSATQGGPNPPLNLLTYQDNLQLVSVPRPATNAISVFPNPATEAATILGLENPQSANVSLYTLDGKQMEVRTETDAESIRILRGALSTGLYLIEIEQNGVRRHEKVLFTD